VASSNEWRNVVTRIVCELRSGVLEATLPFGIAGASIV